MTKLKLFTLSIVTTCIFASVSVAAFPTKLPPPVTNVIPTKLPPPVITAIPTKLPPPVIAAIPTKLPPPAMTQITALT